MVNRPARAGRDYENRVIDFLAGVYPPAMKMAATWFRARRGLAIGTVGVVMAARTLRTQLFGVPAFDPIASGAAAFTCTGSALFCSPCSRTSTRPRVRNASPTGTPPTLRSRH